MKGIFWNGTIEDNFLGHQMAEIYKDAIYAPYLNGRSNLTILDVGANIGIFSLYASQFASKVYAIEPAKEHFEALTHQLSYNGLSNVIPLNMALGDKDESMNFYHRAYNRTMWSLTPAKEEIDPHAEVEVVKVMRIDTFLTENKIEHVDFMKLDVEGMEYRIVLGEGFEQAAPKIDELLVEIHSWAERTQQQMIDGLKMNGFTKVSRLPNDAALIHASK